MDTQPLYDLTPTLHLMIMSVLVALGPLSWLWLRNKKAQPARRLQALTLLVLFLTFDLVMFGSFTRLTDSGLGCPDWPGCYGNASPVGAHAEITKAEAAMPTGPVTKSKAWIEMIHRYLAMAVGVLLITLTAATWLQRRRGAPVSAWWPGVTLAWVCLQGAFGALTVTMKLFPAIVTLHLLAGIVLLALLVRQAVAYSHAHDGRAHAAVAPPVRAWLFVALALVWLQIALGGWVSTNYAVLACTDFPTCQGRWWPEMNFREGFELWRELGKTAGGDYLAFPALTAVHYAHRLAAYVVLVALGGVAWALRQAPALRRQARWIAGLALLQLATGLANVVLDWPIAAAVLHTGGASALVIVLTWALCESRVQRAATSGAASHGVCA